MNQPTNTAGQRYRRLRRPLIAGFAAAAIAMPVLAQDAAGSIYNDPYADRSTQQQPGGALQGTQAAAQAATGQAATGDRPAERYQPDSLDTPTSEGRQRDTSSPDSSNAASRDSERRSDRENANEDQPTRAVRPRILPPSEFETFVSQVTDKRVRRFGAELLVPDARGFTTPPTTTVPTDYRINPGDELVIGLSGAVQANALRLVVDSEGRIFVPRVGAVAVGGVRYGDVQRVVETAVSRQYRSFRISVSVGRLHGITVYVTGYAATPGSYTVSSLSTLVNAVLAAGGPAAGGSFRDIEVRRGGRLVSRFDLYDLLLKGDKSGDVILQNGDVIRIAAAGAQVGVIGSVNTEAVFEAKPGETLGDVLRYAGGFNTVADDSRLLLLDSLRTDGSGWQQLAPGMAELQPARRGQVLRALSGIGIARPLRDQAVLVTISGEVAHPGRFFVPPGTSLGAAIAQAGGITAQAYPFATVMTRESLRNQQRLSYDRAVRDLDFLLSAQPLTSADQATQLQPARLQAVRAVIGQLEARKPDGRLVLDIAPDATALPADLVLENNDSVYVPPLPNTVGVFGSVPSPASFSYNPALTIGDYLRRAGGVQQFGDRGHIFVIRANGVLLPPKHGAFAGTVLSARALPGDLIFVPIAANRGEFWARLRDATAVLFQGALIGASVASISK